MHLTLAAIPPVAVIAPSGTLPESRSPEPIRPTPADNAVAIRARLKRFLSATVYRTDLVKRGLKIWKDALNNWMFLAYLAGYCAVNGSIIVTKDIYMECVIGVSYWQKDQKSALLMMYKHLPEVIIKLEEIGYSRQFRRLMIMKNFQEVNLKVLLGALRRWPFYTIETVIPFLTLVGMSAFELMTLKNIKVPESSHPTTQPGFLTGVI